MRIPIHHVRIPRIWNRSKSVVENARKRPSRSEILTFLPVSIPSIPSRFHSAKKPSVEKHAMARKSVQKKRGTATYGDVRGLTRKRITSSEASDRNAAAATRRRRGVKRSEKRKMKSEWLCVCHPCKKSPKARKSDFKDDRRLPLCIAAAG